MPSNEQERQTRLDCLITADGAMRLHSVEPTTEQILERAKAFEKFVKGDDD